MTLRDVVLKGDPMLAYWPGKCLYMGLQRATEDGPHEQHESVPGAQAWPG